MIRPLAQCLFTSRFVLGYPHRVHYQGVQTTSARFCPCLYSNSSTDLATSHQFHSQSQLDRLNVGGHHPHVLRSQPKLSLGERPTIHRTHPRPYHCVVGHAGQKMATRLPHRCTCIITRLVVSQTRPPPSRGLRNRDLVTPAPDRKSVV